MNFDQLLYDGQLGDDIARAAALVVRHGFAGMVFNGIVVRRDFTESSMELVRRYWELIEEQRQKGGKR